MATDILSIPHQFILAPSLLDQPGRREDGSHFFENYIYHIKTLTIHLYFSSNVIYDAQSLYKQRVFGSLIAKEIRFNHEIAKANLCDWAVIPPIFVSHSLQCEV